MEIKLDLKDWKLLRELDINAKQSISEIGKKILLNKNTVNYRMNRLEKEGIITGYTATINNVALGYNSFRVYLDFLNTTEKEESEIIEYLKSQKIIGVVATIDQGHDLAFISWTKDPYEFDSFWTTFKEKFKQNIWKEEVSFFSEVYHFKRNYLTTETSPKYEFIGKTPVQKIDELDMKILQTLVKNARTLLIDIAENLKTPPRTIAARIKKLEQNQIIQGYRVNINLEKIGYEYHKLNITLDQLENYDSLLTFAKNNKNVIYLDKSISNYDLEIDIEVKDKTELKKLINEIKQKFKVREIQILTFEKYHKLETLPEL